MIGLKDRQDQNLKKRRGKWSTEEHQRYLHAIQVYNDQMGTVTEKWKFIQSIIMTRTVQQCRSHHQKYELKLKQLASRRQQHQYLQAITRPIHHMHHPQDYPMPSYHHHRQTPYQQMYHPPPSHQQEYSVMMPYRQQQQQQHHHHHHQQQQYHLVQQQHQQQQQWQQHAPPPHSSQYYEPPRQFSHQHFHPSNTPSSMPPSTCSSPPPPPPWSSDSKIK